MPGSGSRLRPALSLLVSLATVTVLLLAFIFSQPPTATAQEPDAQPPPRETLDAEAGFEIYTERCATCHGPLGEGDGVSAQDLPRPPAELADEAFLQQAVPEEMFDVITNGILTSGMPPFGPASSNPLTVEERWQVIAAIYSLGTPGSEVEAGQQVWEASCQSCHGADGTQGDVDLSAPSYWAVRSNLDVLETVMGAEIPEHQGLSLAEEEVAVAVDYARTLSYLYSDVSLAFAPIETAVISGTVTNQTTGEPLPAGSTVELTGFTEELEPLVIEEGELEAGGTYHFELSEVEPNLIFVVTTEYNEVSFASNPGRLDRDNPQLALPLAVYERTDDASAVSIGDLTIILEFTEDGLQVSELYQFSQEANAVYVGPQGEPQQGTVRVMVPEGASTPAFSRSFGGVESFVPAQDMVPVDGGWADISPLRPGEGTLSLLVRYSMPYDRGLAFSHPLAYPVDSASLFMPDVGVSLSGSGGWQERGSQQMGEAGDYVAYSTAGIGAGEPLQFELQGLPRRVMTPEGMVAVRDDVTELLLGGGVLLLVLVAGGFTLLQWRKESKAPVAEPAADGDGSTGPPTGRSKEELLYKLATLDDGYEAGHIAEDEYRQKRQALKAELVAIWDETDAADLE
jgi:mono/diheme cytochrome c family protein